MSFAIQLLCDGTEDYPFAHHGLNGLKQVGILGDGLLDLNSIDLGRSIRPSLVCQIVRSQLTPLLL